MVADHQGRHGEAQGEAEEGRLVELCRHRHRYPEEIPREKGESLRPDGLHQEGQRNGDGDGVEIHLEEREHRVEEREYVKRPGPQGETALLLRVDEDAGAAAAEIEQEYMEALEINARDKEMKKAENQGRCHGQEEDCLYHGVHGLPFR